MHACLCVHQFSSDVTQREADRRMDRREDKPIYRRNDAWMLSLKRKKNIILVGLTLDSNLYLQKFICSTIFFIYMISLISNFLFLLSWIHPMLLLSRTAEINEENKEVILTNAADLKLNYRVDSNVDIYDKT